MIINARKLSILYFDDEPSCLKIFREMFGDAHEIRTARTLGDARRAIDESFFDVVISDQLMPEIRGMDFLNEIARTHPESLRVLMTGSTCIGEVLNGVTTGVIKIFVPKPWSDEMMQQVFERARIWSASAR